MNTVNRKLREQAILIAAIAASERFSRSGVDRAGFSSWAVAVQLGHVTPDLERVFDLFVDVKQYVERRVNEDTEYEDMCGEVECLLREGFTPEGWIMVIG